MAFILNYPLFAASDENGVPLSGGKVNTFEAGTSTPKVTYSDRALTTPNTNPVILDSRGEATIWGTGSYKVVLEDSDDVQIWSMDDVEFGDADSETITFPLSIENGGTGGASSTAARSNLNAQEDVVSVRGDIVVSDSTGSAAKLALGLNGQVLSSNGTDAVWQSVSASSVVTTRGDLIVGDSTGSASRLPTGTAGQVLTSDGTDTAFQDSSGGEWSFVSEGTASVSSSVDFTGLLAGSDYKFIFRAVLPTTNAVNFQMRYGTGATPTWEATSYDYACTEVDQGATFARFGSNGITEISITNAASSSSALAISGQVVVTDVGNSAIYTRSFIDVAYGIMTSIIGCGSRRVAEAITGVRFFTSSDTIASGVIEMWRREAQ